jgi:hypothetical protein
MSSDNTVAGRQGLPKKRLRHREHGGAVIIPRSGHWGAGDDEMNLNPNFSGNVVRRNYVNQHLEDARETGAPAEILGARWRSNAASRSYFAQAALCLVACLNL